jgi:hypothetical protein
VKRAFVPRSAAVLVVAAAAVTLLVVRLLPAAAEAPRSGALEVHDGKAVAAGTFVAANELRGPRGPSATLRRGPQRLERAASAPLVGGDGPVAAASPDGALVAYSTWQWTRPIDWARAFAEQDIATGDPLGTPTLRIHDVEARRDRALEPGSFGAAWRSDGALAYVAGDPVAYRANEPYLVRVVVRASVSAPAERWTAAPDRYRVVGWAGSRLVVVRGHSGGAPDVLVLDGPDRARLIAAGAGALAIAPDGARLLVSVGEPATPSAALGLREVETGREVASLPLASIVDPVSGHATQWISAPASWVGDRVLAATDGGLVVLRVSRDRLEVEQVLHVDMDRFTSGSIHEPRFADAATREIVWWADVPWSGGEPQSVQFVCDRFALACSRQTPVVASAAPRPVYDQSGGSR